MPNFNISASNCLVTFINWKFDVPPGFGLPGLPGLPGCKFGLDGLWLSSLSSLKVLLRELPFLKPLDELLRFKRVAFRGNGGKTEKRSHGARAHGRLRWRLRSLARPAAG